MSQPRLDNLRQRGVHVIDPDEGELASGLEGKGRLAEPERIREELTAWFRTQSPLPGRRALGTAGPTHEPLDAVRFLGNRSTGRQGVAIAEELARRGMVIDLIAGPLSIEVEDHPGIHRVDVQTALEMDTAAQQALAQNAPDVIIGTAAVADVRPAHPIEGKAAKSDLPHSVDLVANPDILAGLNAAAPESCLKIGFALAHDDGTEAALRKLTAKQCDLIVLNSLADKGAGFGHKTNRVRFVHGPNRIDSFDLKSKEAVATDLADVIQSRLLQSNGPS